MQSPKGHRHGQDISTTQRATGQASADPNAKSLADNTWTDRQKLALTCRILFESSHDSGLAGQITARGPQPGTYYTQQLGLGFDEITASNLLLVNEDLEVLEGHGMANPANRFHSWVYRARPDVNCIIHTHPTHIAALSMLEVPLEISTWTCARCTTTARFSKAGRGAGG